MISEAIQLLLNTGANGKRLIRLSELSHNTSVAYDKGDGEIIRHSVPAPYRTHHLTNIEDLCASLVKYGSPETTSVWVANTLIEGVLEDTDDSYREDKVFMEIQEHYAMNVLRRDCSRWQSQKELVEMVRHDFSDTIIDPGSFETSIKKLKFATASEEAGEYTHTSAAMGKSIEGKVTAAADLPERVSISFNMYPQLADQFGSLVKVECDLYTAPTDGELKLSPIPGQLEMAKRHGTGFVVNYLRDNLEGYSVYSGYPNE